MRTLLVAVLVGAAGCSSGTPLELKLTWSFEAGDCVSNAVTTVRVDGVGEFDCSVGEVVVPEERTFVLAGLDANGVERFRGRSTSLNVTLRPKRADVTVKWTFPGFGSCADGIDFPYFVALYEWPGSTTTPPTTLVSEIHEACATGAVVFRDVEPRKYLLDVASRASSPDIHARVPLTVATDEDVTIDVEFP